MNLSHEHDSSSNEPHTHTLKIVFYTLFAALVFLTLFGRPYLIQQIRDHALEPVYVFAIPALFLAVLLGYLFINLVTKPAAHSRRFLLSILFGALVLSVVVPDALREFKTRSAPPAADLAFLEQMFDSKDARVRALVMLALGQEVEQHNFAHLVAKGLEDKDPFVQEAAKLQLTQRLGHAFSEGELGLKEAKNFVQGLLG